MIRTIIADDEPLARARLQMFLQQQQDVEIVRVCGDGMATVQAIEELRPDLLFLDVQMPEMDGFEVFLAVGESQMPVTIFVTAFDVYALQAFEVNASDYLLKPTSEERLSKALNRARRRIENRPVNLPAEDRMEVSEQGSIEEARYLNSIAIRTRDRVLHVQVDTIDWIEAEGNYLIVHVGKQVLDFRGTLTSLMQQLSPKKFVRIHRSTVVNRKRITCVHPWHNGYHLVTLRSGQELRMSRYCREGRELLTSSQMGAPN